MNISKLPETPIFIDYDRAEELAHFLLSTGTLIEHNNEQVTTVEQLKQILIAKEISNLENGLSAILEKKESYIPNNRKETD